MREWLAWLSEQAVVLIDAVALLIILVATVKVVIGIARAMLSPISNRVAREEWLIYTRWLVAGLTLQLAADIIETSVSTSWNTIGRVGAIAVIRTFLNYFLDQDVEEIRARQKASGAPAPPAAP